MPKFTRPWFHLDDLLDSMHKTDRMTQTCCGEYQKILNTVTDLDYGDANDGKITASTAFEW